MPRKSGGSTISRASVLNFLEAMREASVLSDEERTGKGDCPWVDKTDYSKIQRLNGAEAERAAGRIIKFDLRVTYRT
jgi:hypothetical protein